jgi:mannose-6-phosphate isomerase
MEKDSKFISSSVLEAFNHALGEDIKTELPSNLPQEINVLHISEVKKVTKPWGFELWLSSGEPGYAFKVIHLKAGSKTSLQLHNEKHEHNLLVSGRIKLHYLDAQTGNIMSSEMEAIQLIIVGPPGVHRIEALTDVLLIEASTPQLDDVVRIADDHGRPDGRIDSEHEK